MEKFYSLSQAPKEIRRLKRIIRSRFYLHINHDIRNSIMVAGTGRSGTTWLAEIIASQLPCRLMFEPFHFKNIPVSNHHLFHYLRPEQEDIELYAYTHKVLTGKVRKPWIDRFNNKFIARYRLIKEIRANLFLKWLNRNFPEVPLLFMIRHPCAVVLSRKELGWATDSDMQPFLKQENLISDFLTDKMEILHSVKTDIEKHAVIWCISNLVPLKQFEHSHLPIIYYENLCLNPEYEIPWVFEALSNKQFNVEQLDIQKPSLTTSVTSAVVTGEDKISRWKNHLSTIEIDRILNIVEEFGLGHLYGDSVIPTAS